MASLNFTERFKTKIEKIGKNGILSLATINPIDKSSVTDQKVHENFITVLPSVAKIRILKNVPIDEKKNELDSFKPNRSSTTLLPLLRTSPTSLSSNIGKKRTEDSPEKTFGVSCSGSSFKTMNKLPQIRSKLQNLKHLLRPS